MHIRCRFFSRRNLATGGVEPLPQMPLTLKGVQIIGSFRSAKNKGLKNRGTKIKGTQILMEVRYVSHHFYIMNRALQTWTLWIFENHKIKISMYCIVLQCNNWYLISIWNWLFKCTLSSLAFLLLKDCCIRDSYLFLYFIML